MDKKSIRAKMIERRLALSKEEYQAKSKAIVATLLRSSFFDKTKPLGLYASMRQEVDTWVLIEQLLKAGVKLALPRVEGDDMEFYYIDDIKSLSPSRFGVMEPVARYKATDLCLLVTPLVAFNKNKERIGYGKGYYDRYIEKYHPQTIGIAFDLQKEAFEVEAHDQPLDYIITETKVY